MKRMLKTTIIITIIPVLLIAILNSCVRIRSYDYQPVVSYESNNTEVSELKEVKTNSDTGAFGSIVKYEQVILISSIILVIIFTFVFFNLNPKKR